MLRHGCNGWPQGQPEQTTKIEMWVMLEINPTKQNAPEKPGRFV